MAGRSLEELLRQYNSASAVRGPGGPGAGPGGPGPGGPGGRGRNIAGGGKPKDVGVSSYGWFIM